MSSRQMTDLIFPGHKSRKNAKSAKIKSAVRKTEKHDRLSADRQMTDLIFRDTVLGRCSVGSHSYWYSSPGIDFSKKNPPPFPPFFLEEP